MTLRHGLAPVRNGEIRSQFLCVAERISRIFVFEVMKQCESAEEICLCSFRAGIGEVDFAEILLGQDRRTDNKEEYERKPNSERLRRRHRHSARPSRFSKSE